MLRILLQSLPVYKMGYLDQQSWDLFMLQVSYLDQESWYLSWFRLVYWTRSPWTSHGSG